MTRLVPLAAACLSGWLAVSTASAAPRQQPALPEPATKSAVVTSTTDAITIDGVLDEPIWRAAPTIGRSDAATARTGPAADGTDRRHAPLRSRLPLRRRRRVRLRAAAGDRHADGARCQPGRRRPRRDPARHVPRSAERLLLRDQSIGRAGGRPGRQWTVECRLGRHLGRAHADAPTRDGPRSSRFRSRA